MNTIKQRMAMRLIGGARGDLQFDANGDVRYGFYYDESTGKELRGANGPKFVIVVSEPGADYTLDITAAGAQFVLENLQGFSKNEERFLKQRAGR